MQLRVLTDGASLLSLCCCFVTPPRRHLAMFYCTCERDLYFAFLCSALISADVLRSGWFSGGLLWQNAAMPWSWRKKYHAVMIISVKFLAFLPVAAGGSRRPRLTSAHMTQ